MSHELPKKVKIFADTAKSCERMSKTLEEAQDILDKAGEDVANAQAEGKSGWVHLSAAIGALRKLMRPDPDTVPWHTEIDYYLDHEPRLRWDAAGEYRTPNPALDFVLANPPMGDIQPADEPLSPGVPPLLPGGADGTEIGTAPWKPLAIPELNISFQRFHSAEYQMYVAGWRDGSNSHVYALTVERVGTEWRAVGTNDGHEVFSVTCPSRHLAPRLGLAAMRAYLIRGHRRAWSKARRLAEDGSPHPEPAPSTKHEAPSTEEEAVQ